MKKKGIRSYLMDRTSSLGVSLEGSLQVVEKAPSSRKVAHAAASGSREDRWNVYMEFIKEVGGGASEDTKRKVRKSLGLEGNNVLYS